MSNSSGTAAEAGTRDRLLRAAVEEFAEVGLAGARVDRIASRAGANKQLVYYYFGSKDGLFDAAVRSMAEQLGAATAASGGLGDRLTAASDAAANDTIWVRLLEFEALQRGEQDVIDETERRASAAHAVAQIKADQKAGLLPASLDPAQLYLAIVALATHPVAFPQLVRHVTGRNPSDTGFKRARRKFLRDVAELLDAGARSGSTTKD